MKQGTLLLANGAEFNGFCFGAEGTTIGEVVFTTSVVGYQEALSDPNYHGQILLQTFPLIGNYGVNDEDYSSDRCHVKGYLVREWCEVPSNFRMQGDIDAFMKQHRIIGLYGIDTRRLTHILREEGAMNGAIFSGEVDKEELLAKIRAYRTEHPVAEVTVDMPQTFTVEGAAHHVAVLDYGYKKSMVDELLKRGCNVTVLPATTTPDQVKAIAPDGIILSDGPGNPAVNTEEIENIRNLVTLGLPIFGISLGHQMLALAMGGKISKLVHGHRGASQPVVDLKRGRTFVTAQNHSYIVDAQSIPDSVGTVSFINANDKSCEGIDYTAIPAFSVQFSPNVISYCAAPESEYDRFVSMFKK